MSGPQQEQPTALSRPIFDPAIALVVLVVVGAALVSVDRAVRRPFWFDEILTVAVATQPSPAAIWDALEQGVDGNPPLFHLVEKASSGVSRKLPVPPELTYRLPSILAFALTVVAVFLFVRHAAGAWSGAAAAAMLLPTQLFTVYAVEARPYALVACAVAWAAVMWQRAERGRSATRNRSSRPRA